MGRRPQGCSEAVPSGKDALTRACGSLNSADLLVMRDFQSLTQGDIFLLHLSLLKEVCFCQGEEGGAGWTVPLKEVGSHRGTALESVHG